MASFFVEYEFESNGGDVYWFPLRINADSSQAAELISTAVETAINENHHVRRRSYPTLVIENLNSDIIREYTERQMNGRIRILDIRLFQFADITNDANLNFGQHLDLVSSNPELIFEHTVATNIEHFELPVRQITNNINDFNEFLLINIISPDDI